MLYCPELDLARAGATNQSIDEHGEHTEGYITEPGIKIIKGAGTSHDRYASALTRAGQRQVRRTRNG